MQDTLSVRGDLHITLRDENGNILQERWVSNLVVDLGLAHIAARIVGNSPTVMSHMELGTGGTAASSADAALESRIVDSRMALASFTASGSTIIAECVFGPGIGSGAVREAGIFNAASAGTMMCRTVFPVINKSSLDTLTIQWYITMAGSLSEGGITTTTTAAPATTTTTTVAP